MPTLADLTEAVKDRYRITDSQLDRLITSFINKSYRKNAQKQQWDNLLVENYSISLTGGTEQYTLPANFWRIAQNGVRYDVTSNCIGKNILVVTSDDLQKWKLITNAQSPEVCAIVAPTSGTDRRIEFQPAFSESKTVNIDYWKNPDELTEDTSELAIPVLEDVIIHEALAELAAYHKQWDEAAQYRSMARDYYRAAIQSEIVY